MVCGSDAGDFLHRLTTQNISSMKEGDRRFAALLSGTSHIQFLFNVELKEKCFVLQTEAERASGLADALEKMHFAEDLKIEVLPGTTDGPWGRLSEDQRIKKGLFKFGKDITEKNLILEAPLNSYLHRDKGCYPGQEVVERVFTYGQVAKKLVAIHLKQPLPEGSELTADGKKVGQVTSSSGLNALAMVQKSHYNSGSKIDQGEVIPLNDSF